MLVHYYQIRKLRRKVYKVQLVNKKVKILVVLSLIFCGIATIILVIISNPSFVTTYFSSDHFLTPGGEKQLENYRLLLSLGGIFLIVSGATLFLIKNPGKIYESITSYLFMEKSGIKVETKTARTGIILFFGFIGIFAYLLILYTTPFGPSVSYDAAKYINAAENIRSGKGFTDTSPIIQYPPFYPILIAATTFIIPNINQGARLLNAFFFGVSAVLVAIIVYQSARKNIFITALIMTFFVATSQLIEIYSYALSEPLFIVLTLASIILCSMYFAKPTNFLLITASIILGFSIITRFIGIAFIPVFLGVVYFGTNGGPQKLRIKQTILALVLAITPLFVFTLRNLLVAQSTAPRSFEIHVIPFYNYISQLGGILAANAVPLTLIELPAGLNQFFFGGLTILLIVDLLIILKNARNINFHSINFILPILCILFSVSYLVFLYLSLSFFDVSTEVDSRIVAPVSVLLLIGLIATTLIACGLSAKAYPGYLLIFALFITLLIKIPDAANRTTYLHKNGRGLTSLKWQTSEIMNYLLENPIDGTLYTNGVDVIWFFTDLEPRSLPYKYFATSLEVNGLYDTQVESMCSDLAKKAALLIWFDSKSETSYFPSETEIVGKCQLNLIKEFEDGRIFGQ